MRARAGFAALALACVRTCVCTCVCAGAVAAQQTHVLIITGLGGEPQYSTTFRTAGGTLYQAAKAWGVAPASLIWLGEDPAADPAINAKSTKEEVAKAFTTLAQRALTGDFVLVFLVGHGGGEGTASHVSLPGVDPTAADYAMWVSAFARQYVVFVNASSASGDFVKPLSARGRVIVSATRTSMERNESVFASLFVRGLSSGEADADKDGRVSVLEAFDYAKKEVARSYEGANKLQTEHAVLSDSLLARSVAFGGRAVTNDPKVQALVAERRILEDALAALKGRKAQMDSTAYATELERLLIAIAEKSQAIRAAGGR